MSDTPSNSGFPSDPERRDNPPSPPPYSSPSGPGPYGPPAYGSPAYGSPAYGAQPSRPKPDNHLVWAILSLVLCCMPLGIVSVVYASQVDGHYARGDYASAEQASARAKNWAIASAAAVVVLFVLWLVFAVGVGLMSAGTFSEVSDSFGS
ncbi:MAG TPA: CD225/dispanin family protein [Kineosporiaceae bacterium]|nr:CD225/dispanin family protein [Kineosporiaceae bacterium]